MRREPLSLTRVTAFLSKLPASSPPVTQLRRASFCFSCGSDLLISCRVRYRFPSLFTMRGCILQLYDIQRSISATLHACRPWHMADIIIEHIKPEWVSAHDKDDAGRIHWSIIHSESVTFISAGNRCTCLFLIWHEECTFTLTKPGNVSRSCEVGLFNYKQIWSTGCCSSQSDLNQTR